MAVAEVISDKGLPSNTLAERSVLGAILLDGLAFNYAAELLRPDDFYLDSHRKIFRAMRELSQRGTAIDYVTVGELLERADELDAVGGLGYLVTLTEGLPRSINVEHYARIVKDRSIQRMLLSAANQISSDVISGMESGSALLDKAQKLIFEVAEDMVKEGLTSVGEITGPLLERIDSLHGQEITGLRTGYKELDQLTAGLQPADLVIIAARPSMGKTSLAMNIAENAAMRYSKKVAVFSLEMAKVQLVLRMLCSTAHVDAHRMRMGFLSREDIDRLTAAAAELSQAAVFIDDTAGIDDMTVRAKCRRLRAERGLDLVVVDYLQLMGSSARFESRNLEISAISRGLKSLAKELNVPVIALSQLSRASEQRKGDHRPILSDLRESGSIEQDADVVAFIYRDEVYNRETDKKGVAEIIVAKQRNGPTDTIELAFLREFTRFENLAERY
jgi:replicative DNA helicase